VTLQSAIAVMFKNITALCFVNLLFVATLGTSIISPDQQVIYTTYTTQVCFICQLCSDCLVSDLLEVVWICLHVITNWWCVHTSYITFVYFS